jgi:tRNA pseudouridine32 synthase/23S rRNA pseudouridine746 synthase
VVDQPHFLPVTPGGRYLHETLLVRLKKKLGLDTLVPIHRIDRETAGLVLFSISPASRDAYQALFRLREVHKHYEAIAPWRADLSLPRTHTSRMVEGAAGEPFFKMFDAPGTPNAETHIELLEQRGVLARYRLSPVTGRKHQLRLHLAALGIPILNDLFYPVVRHSRDAADDYTQPLQLLAQRLQFTDPLSGQPRQFQSQRRLDWPPSLLA